MHLLKTPVLVRKLLKVVLRKDVQQGSTAMKHDLETLQNYNAHDVVKLPAEHQTVSMEFIFLKKYSE